MADQERTACDSPGLCKLCGQPKHSIESIAPECVRPVSRTYREYSDASHHCFRCAVVVKATEACVGVPHPSHTRLEMCKAPELGLHIVTVSQKTANIRTMRHTALELFIRGETLEASLESQFRQLKSGDTSSDQSLQTVLSWVEACIKDHHICPSNRTSRLPKRILELSPDHIVLREHVPGLHQYACLSHCWGEAGLSMKLTCASMAAFKDKISMASLPKTFFEAAQFCLRAGVRFLWIDALCIKQDDEADWRDVASTMAAIYQNAYICIAATKSKDSTEGLYVRNDHKYSAQPIGLFNIIARERSPDMSGFVLNPDEQRNVWPLLSRAWVYQERRLSPRVIHFGNQKIIWECRSWRQCEDGNLDEELKPDDRSVHDKGGSEAAWQRIVEEYAGLGLTFETDRLPAIAAIAGKMIEFYGRDKYLAGLWKDTLLEGIMWFAYPDFETDLPGRPGQWTAPTWSWASVSCKVRYRQPRHDRYDERVETVDRAQLLGVVYSITGPENIGQLERGANITLRSPAVRATLDQSYELKSEIESTVRMSHFHSFRPDYNLKELGAHHVPCGTTVYVVPIQETQASFTALVLRNTEGSNHERVGVGYLMAESLYSDDPRLISDPLVYVREFIASLPLMDFTII